ncbi:hypothetical protein HHK36_024852 [Tetracentron sinense]|uniref:RING-type domain-containing protein n=1 Tax=Tetracentron sinense TaxID=13715 RepID=A0A834YL06_TETSI|nr:hypothetical protein HHK36_024852 [Tetracentron sinense]
MGSDSITNAPVPALLKDFGKKKRTNRLAKLKQCKLDARREQWLSQGMGGINAVKNRGCKDESNGGVGSPPLSLHTTHEQDRSLENLETRSREEENRGSCLHDSDLESVTNSSTSSVLGGGNSTKDRPGSSSGSSNGGCCSGSVSEEEEGDGCLDDWEAVADALNADDYKRHNPTSESPAEPETVDGLDPELLNNGSGVDILKPEREGTLSRSPVNGRAWRPDDAFRPQSLPNLLKQHSFPMNLERHCGSGAVTWVCHSIISQPSSCPICYEDLDLTDSSFLPCSCGFRLCLFCHKRILEADRRCPGCRKQYDPINGEMGVNGETTLPFRLSRSCSMSRRS